MLVLGVFEYVISQFYDYELSEKNFLFIEENFRSEYHYSKITAKKLRQSLIFLVKEKFCTRKGQNFLFTQANIESMAKSRKRIELQLLEGPMTKSYFKNFYK